MSAPTVTLRCVDMSAALAVYQHAVSVGAPASTSGCLVTLPADQPGFLIAQAELAVANGHASDEDAARCIGAMSDVIDRERERAQAAERE